MAKMIRMIVRYCSAMIGAVAGLAIWTTASAEDCPEKRTPLEMAGHTFCLLNSAMPKIGRDENGSVTSLTWRNPERLPENAKLPPGVFYLIVEAGQLYMPALEDTEPSDLPEMRQETFFNFNRTFYYPQQARLNGQPFRLECREAIISPRELQGAQDCEIYAMANTDIRVHVFFGTVVWVGPAWPKLDEHWVETWPPYLDDLGAGIGNLLSLQP